MELIDYGLKVGNKTLFENVHVEFEKKVISHVLGCN